MLQSALLVAVLVGAASGFHDADHGDLVGPHSRDPSTDCAMRNLTYGYALALLPNRAPLVSVFDALRLALDCNMTRPSTPPTPRAPFYAATGVHTGEPGRIAVLRTQPLPPAGTAAWYVDASLGSDANPCTLVEPCRTVAHALAESRASGGGGSIILRGGAPHVLSAPLSLSPEDSHLAISAYPGEAPLLSGGIPLTSLGWTRVGPSPDPTANATVWAASLSGQNGSLQLPFGALFFEGRRAVRARWPNGNPETDIVPQGYTRAAAWLPPAPPSTPLVQINPQFGTPPRTACPADACTPGGPSGIGPPWAIFCCFFWGVNASVQNFTTGSFWGVHPGPPGGPTYHVPGGLIAGPDLLPRLANWTCASSAFVHAFHGSYWGDWAFSVGNVNATSGAVAFAAGGWQEARGASTGDFLYFENIFEELDAPGEWFVDADAKMLFYCANGTQPPPAEGWVASQLDSLVSAVGSPAAPVTNVTLSGLTFAYSEPTFMSPFTAPSGGDWSFHDGGAVRFSGTADCAVVGSLFINLGGSGVMLSGWNRRASVVDSEFLWLGEHAVVSAGLSGDRFDSSESGAPFGEGPVIARNLGHELGIFVKQSGFYYHAMTANASVGENVFFNGPRAGININDGFGGGHNVSRNVGFNLVRETSDHGPFNSWDRNTYQWAPGRVEPLPMLLDRNLFVCNYHCVVPIDNDDGSNGYVETNNWLLWGGTKSLMGYNKHFINNTFVYVDYTPVVYAHTLLRGAEPRPLLQAGSAPSPSPSPPPAMPPFEPKPGICACTIASAPFAASGLQDQWWNNSCIAASGSRFFKWESCNSSAPLDGTIPFPIRANRYYSGNATYTMACQGEEWSFAEAQARGVDLESSVAGLPSLTQLVAWGHELLQF